MLHWQFDPNPMATRRRPKATVLLATFLAALLAVTSLAAAPENEEPQDEEPTARQGTPALGVVIGKPQDAEAAEVLRVWPGSAAQKAGIQRGDRIVKVDEDEVQSPEALRAAVLKRAPGDQVELTVVRDGEPQSMTVELGGTDDFRGWARRGPITRQRERGPWLGVLTAPVRSAEERGVLVRRVFPGSPADAAGLKSGDAILRVDKTRVEAHADLKAAIESRRPAETITLVVRRDGERQKVQVTLGTFADWHRTLEQRTERQLREVLRDLAAASADLAEDALPEEARRRRRLRARVDLPTLGVAKLAPTEGHDARGAVVLRQTEDGVHLTGEVRGLKAGLHGFHIHEYGDLRGPKGLKAGGHFNPEDTKHGGPDDEEHHMGDLGNIEANEDGVAEIDIQAPWLRLHFVLGRALVVHAGEDDLETQPTGDAGPRAAIGVIGIGNPGDKEDG